MSKRANHWYLAESTLRAMGNAFRLSGRTWLVTPVIVAVLFVVILLTRPDPESLRASQWPIVLVFLAVFLVWLMRMRARWRAAYLNALQSPTADQLIAVVTKLLQRAQVLPDSDAMLAQARALAYALYGAEAQAIAAGAAIDWDQRAPLIQSLGKSAESLVHLLCRRDAGRAVELAREAQALSTVSNAVPGASQTRLFHAVCIGASEAFGPDGPSPESVLALETAAAKSPYPQVKVLATAGLAAAMERSGDAARTRALRDWLATTAPHCAPLQMTLQSFAAGLNAPAVPAAPATFTTTDSGESFSVKSARPRIAILISVWVALMIAFVVMWQLLNSTR